MRKLWSSKYKWLRCTPPCRQKLLRNSQKKEIKEGVAIGVFRSILFLLFFSFCYRRCGSVKVKLVLNFSMQLNSVYTIQNYKVFIQYFQKSVKPADLILKDAFRHWK